MERNCGNCALAEDNGVQTLCEHYGAEVLEPLEPSEFVCCKWRSKPDELQALREAVTSALADIRRIEKATRVTDDGCDEPEDPDAPDFPEGYHVTLADGMASVLRLAIEALALIPKEAPADVTDPRD